MEDQNFIESYSSVITDCLDQSKEKFCARQVIRIDVRYFQAFIKFLFVVRVDAEFLTV